MFGKSVLVSLVSVGVLVSGAYAGLFEYTLGKWTDSNKSDLSNPCQNESFTKEHGKYCTGFLSKSVRCLSEGSKPGVCDTAEVCDPLNRTVKKVCESHCLNTGAKNLGNQNIKISCVQKPELQKTNHKMLNPFEEGRLGLTAAWENQQDNSSEDWVEVGTQASEPVDPKLQSIHPDQGNEDDITKSAHTKEFDQVTENEWKIDSMDFGVSGNPNAVRSGGQGHHHNQWNGDAWVGGTLSRVDPDQEDSDLPKAEAHWTEQSYTSTYPLDEIDALPVAVYNYEPNWDQSEWGNNKVENRWSDGNDVWEDTSKSVVPSSYREALTSRYVGLPD